MSAYPYDVAVPLAREPARLALARFADATLERLAEDEASALDAIVAHCEQLPLTLRLAGVLARDSSFADALQRIERARGQSPQVRAQLPSMPALHVFEAAYQALKKPQRLRYRDLGLVPDDEPVSEPVMAALWQRDRADVRSVLDSLAARALLAHTDGRFWLHDLQRQYIRARDDDPAARHERLLQALSSLQPLDPERHCERAISDQQAACQAYLRRRRAYHSTLAQRPGFCDD